MRASLDDNTRSALHFIVLGLGLAGGLRLAYDLAERWLLGGHAEAAALLPWRAGYLLADAHALVPAAPALPLRLAAAVGYALLGGTLAAALARMLGGTAWVAVGRAVGALVLAPALASALFLPPHSATPDPAAGTWHLCARAALPGGITLPWTATCTSVPAGAVAVHQRADVLELTLHGTTLAAASRGGTSPVDSVHARRAIDVLQGHLPARAGP